MAGIRTNGITTVFDDARLDDVKKAVVAAAHDGAYRWLRIADELEAVEEGAEVDRNWTHVLIGPGIAVTIFTHRDATDYESGTVIIE